MHSRPILLFTTALLLAASCKQDVVKIPGPSTSPLYFVVTDSNNNLYYNDSFRQLSLSYYKSGTKQYIGLSKYPLGNSIVYPHVLCVSPDIFKLSAIDNINTYYLEDSSIMKDTMDIHYILQPDGAYTVDYCRFNGHSISPQTISGTTVWVYVKGN